MLTHKILVAQDEPTIFDHLKMRAEHIHFPFVLDWVQNGPLAVNKIKEDPSYDAILMNLEMPLLDGAQAAKEIRKLEYNRPIIAWSAHAKSWAWEDCQKAGMDAYVQIGGCTIIEDITLALCSLGLIQMRFRNHGEKSTFVLLPQKQPMRFHAL